MDKKYEVLFQPMNINGMRLRNRITMSPMGTFTPMQDGTDSEEGMRYYEERAKGGIGLINTGAMFLNEVVAQGGPTIAFDNGRSIPKGTVLVERVHRWGAKICAQISCGTGRNGMPNIGEKVPISASEIPSFYNPDMICRALTIEEIQDIMRDWKTAAANAVAMGFDAIQVHAHAGYLIDQFLSPDWNHRTDAYGGSLENRCRFAVETVQAIRSVVGPRFPIIFRISLDHRYNGGRTMADSMPILEILEQAGVDAFDIDCGAYESLDYIFPTRYNGEACMAYVCAEARKHVKVPLINGGSHSVDSAAELLASGNADFVQFGRQSIADPQFVNKLKNGHPEDIRPCILCNEECIGRILGRLTQLSCTVNPSTGLETYMEVKPLPQAKNVVVIGAGPGGLEAARTAAIRGCNVTVYDRADHFGGTFAVIASHASFKARIRKLLAWYEVQLRKLGVKVVLGREITPEDPVLAAADEIFVATGSKPFLPNIPGLDQPNVVDVVQAHRDGVAGDGVVICGGGLSGCDTALELYEQGKRDITIVEMREDVAMDAMSVNKISIDRLLREYGIRLCTSARVTGIRPEGVEVLRGEHTEILPAQTIIAAFGQLPNKTEAEAFQLAYPTKTTLIGDCVQIGMSGPAIRGGFYAAMALQ